MEDRTDKKTDGSTDQAPTPPATEEIRLPGAIADGPTLPHVPAEGDGDSGGSASRPVLLTDLGSDGKIALIKAPDGMAQRPEMSGEPPIDPLAPLPASDFEMLECLGRGGMGEVYRARQRSLGRTVAVKTMRCSLLSMPEAVERFLREGRAVASLSHPNIVNVYGIGRLPDGGYFMVMDLIEGVGLDRALGGGGPLDPRRAATIMSAVADAVDHANSRGVIHRDLKPANILIGVDDRPTVTDFGLARLTFSAGLSSPGQVVGTVQFMAPEQVDPRRWGDIGPRTDVYGLGATLLNLLTGRTLWQGEEIADVLMQINSPTQPPRWPGADEGNIYAVPASLRVICMKCLAKDAAERFASGGEVAGALRTWLEKSETATTQFAGESDWFDSLGGLAMPGRDTWAIMRDVAIGLVALAIGVGGVMLADPWQMWSPRENGSNARTNDSGKMTGPADRRLTLPVDVDWDIVCFSAAREENGVSLADSPRAVVSGDWIRIDARLSRPCYAYLYWIDAEGEVSRLAWTEEERSALSYPGAPGEAIEIIGPPGTDVAVLLVTDTPLTSEDDLARLLRPPEPFPPLIADTILVDGRVMIAEERDRGLGIAGTLDGGQVVTKIDNWLENLQDKYGQLHYVAMPHRSANK